MDDGIRAAGRRPLLGRAVSVSHCLLLALTLAGITGCKSSRGFLRVATTKERTTRPSPAATSTANSQSPADVAFSPVVSQHALAEPAPTPGNASFGPNGTVWVERAALNATWVAWCDPDGDAAALATSTRSQVSEGARPARKVRLQWMDGRTQVIASVLGQSTSGRGLVIDTGEGWQLIDTVRKKTIDLTELGVDRRRALNDLVPRGIAFHPTLPVIALLTAREARSEIVVLDYDTGASSTIRPSTQQVFRMSWEASGEFLFLQEIPEDSNGNRRIDWPEPELTRETSGCGETRPRFIVASSRTSDRVAWTVAPRTGGAATAADGFLLYTPGGWLTLTSDARIALRTTSGVRQLTPPGCEVWPVAAHGPTRQLLVGCYEKGRLGLNLVSRRGSVALGVDMPPAEDLRHRRWTSRFLPVYAGVRSHLIDFERATAIELQERDQLLAQHGAHVLIRRASSIVRRNLSNSEEFVLATDVASGSRVVFGNGHAWLDPYLVSAEPGFDPLKVPHTVAALSLNGCALSYEQPFDPPHFPRGPLRWICTEIPSDSESALTSAATDPKRASGSIASPCSTHESTLTGSSGRNCVSLGRGAVVAAL
jgi:hypothetical protein